MTGPEGNKPIPDVGICPDFFNKENPCQGNVLEDFNAAGEHTGELFCYRDDCRLKSNEGGGAKASYAGEAPVQRGQETGAELELTTPQPKAHPDFPPYIELEDTRPPFGGHGSSLHFKHYFFESPDNPSLKDLLGQAPFLIDEAHRSSPQQGCPALFPEDTHPEVLDATRNADGTFSVEQKAMPHTTALDELLRLSHKRYQDYLHRMGVLQDQEQSEPTATQIPLKDGFGRDLPPVTILHDLPNVEPAATKDLGMQPYPTPRLSAHEILKSLLRAPNQASENTTDKPSLGALIKRERDEEIGILYDAAAKGEPTDLPEPLTSPSEDFTFNQDGMLGGDTGDIERRWRDLNNALSPLLEDKESSLPLGGSTPLTSGGRNVLEPPIEVYIPSPFKPVNIDDLSPEERSDLEATLGRVDEMLKEARRTNPEAFEPGIDFDALVDRASASPEERSRVDERTTRGFGYVEMTDPNLGDAPEIKGQYFEERARGYRIDEPETGGDA